MADVGDELEQELATMLGEGGSDPDKGAEEPQRAVDPNAVPGEQDKGEVVDTTKSDLARVQAELADLRSSLPDKETLDQVRNFRINQQQYQPQYQQPQQAQPPVDLAALEAQIQTELISQPGRTISNIASTVAARAVQNATGPIAQQIAQMQVENFKATMRSADKHYSAVEKEFQNKLQEFGGETAFAGQPPAQTAKALSLIYKASKAEIYEAAEKSAEAKGLFKKRTGETAPDFTSRGAAATKTQGVPEDIKAQYRAINADLTDDEIKEIYEAEELNYNG